MPAQAVTELIPHRPPFLFVDEIVAETAGGITARRTWRADEDFYRGHYPGAPITPGVLLCEAVFQTGAIYLARQAQAAGASPGEGTGGVPLLAKISDVRFRSPIHPGDTIIIDVKKKETLGGFTMMSGAIKKADGTRVLTVDFSVTWKTPEGRQPPALPAPPALPTSPAPAIPLAIATPPAIAIPATSASTPPAPPAA